MQRSIVDLPEPDGPAIDDRLAAADREVDLVEHEVVAERLADARELHDVPCGHRVRNYRMSLTPYGRASPRIPGSRPAPSAASKNAVTRCSYAGAASRIAAVWRDVGQVPVLDGPVAGGAVVEVARGLLQRAGGDEQQRRGDARHHVLERGPGVVPDVCARS